MNPWPSTRLEEVPSWPSMAASTSPRSKISSDSVFLVSNLVVIRSDKLLSAVVKHYFKLKSVHLIYSHTCSPLKLSPSARYLIV